MAILSLWKFYIPILLLKDEHFEKKLRFSCHFKNWAPALKNEVNLIYFLRDFMAIWSLRKFYIPILLLKDECFAKKNTALSLFGKLAFFRARFNIISVQPYGHIIFGFFLRAIKIWKITISVVKYSWILRFGSCVYNFI